MPRVKVLISLLQEEPVKLPDCLKLTGLLILQQFLKQVAEADPYQHKITLYFAAIFSTCSVLI